MDSDKNVWIVQKETGKGSYGVVYFLKATTENTVTLLLRQSKTEQRQQMKYSQWHFLINSDAKIL